MRLPRGKPGPLKWPPADDIDLSGIAKINKAIIAATCSTRRASLEPHNSQLETFYVLYRLHYLHSCTIAFQHELARPEARQMTQMAQITLTSPLPDEYCRWQQKERCARSDIEECDSGTYDDGPNG